MCQKLGLDLHLDITNGDAGSGRLREEENGHGNQAGDGEGDGSEEAEDILEADERGVHRSEAPFERGDAAIE